MRPHAPQFVRSVERFTHVVPQSVSPSVAGHAHAPMKQTPPASHVTPHAHDVADESMIRERLASLSNAVDLREPFERIRAAIEEA